MLWLGWDVAWDVYILLGTTLFAWAMWTHPRLGRGFAITDILLAVLLLTFNLYTFPETPAESNLVDLESLVDLWHLAAIPPMWRALAWARRALTAA